MSLPTLTALQRRACHGSVLELDHAMGLHGERKQRAKQSVGASRVTMFQEHLRPPGSVRGMLATVTTYQCSH
eukprot:3960490-Lingulodinium_polyedra.AAC.1